MSPLSGMALLPDDLLGDLLLLSTDQLVDGKFAVAQVSRRLRRIALATPLLWSSFRLATSSDYGRLSVLLERSGACALDIILRPTSPGAVIPAHVKILAQHAPRIRALDVTGGWKHMKKLAPLLKSKLDFPILERLCVSFASTGIRVAAAPSLRVLRLALVNADLTALEPLLGPQLETLELLLHTRLEVSDLLPIGWQCPTLNRLCLRKARRAEPAFTGSAPTSNRLIEVSLTTLDLSLSFPDTLEVLNMSFFTTPRDISAQVTGSLDGTDIARLYVALLRNVDTLVAYELKSHKKLVLRDALGRVRALSLVDSGRRSFDIHPDWHALATQNYLCTALETLDFPASLWNALVDALAMHPVRSRIIGVQLRIVLDLLPDTGDAQITRRRNARPEWRGLTLDELDSVELVILDNTTNLPNVVPYILTRLHSNHTRVVRVVVKGATGGMDWEGAQALQSLVQSRVAHEAQGTWDVSFV